MLHHADMTKWRRRMIARIARGDLVCNLRLQSRFARDSAHSPAKASVRASRGIQHTRIGRALSGGRTESGEGECAGLSLLVCLSPCLLVCLPACLLVRLFACLLANKQIINRAPDVRLRRGLVHSYSFSQLSFLRHS